MFYLKGKNILLGVTSGVAIYKTLDLVSKLRKADANLKVFMTEDASKLINPVLFSSVGECKVYTDIFKTEDGKIIHIEIPKQSDLYAVLPATANTIAKIAHGIADNLVTLAALSSISPKLIVPTMNTKMYQAPSTQNNLKILREYGWYVMNPEEGHLACGEKGLGRYPENEKILEVMEYLLAPKDLKGKKVLVTAGPTYEDIDPVRFIGNKSSGKMGYEIARECAVRGAKVTLISGPTNLTPPYLVDNFVKVRSAEEMYEIVIEEFPKTDIVIMAAAVADFKPKKVFDEKIKKNQDEIVIELIKNVDILKTLGINLRYMNPDAILVGFAAETEGVIEYAKAKLVEKVLDIIVANDVKRKDIGFESEFNEVHIINKLGEIKHVEKSNKRSIAVSICNSIVEYISRFTNTN